MSPRATILAGLAGAVMIGLGTALGIVLATGNGESGGQGGQPPPVNRMNPQAVATTFLTRYVTGTASACRLVTGQLREQMTADGRCHGQARSAGPPSITYLRKVLCPPASPSSSTVIARVTPSGPIGGPYVRLSLENHGKKWLVSGFEPRSTGPTGKPARCKPANSEYGE